MLDMHQRVGGDRDPSSVPEQPFYGDAYQLHRDSHILCINKPRQAHYLREKLAELMSEKVVIPKQYWLLAADAAYRHECILGKQLPKARKPMKPAQEAELKALLEQEEDQFEALEPEMQVSEATLECEKCNTPKLAQQT